MEGVVSPTESSGEDGEHIRDGTSAIYMRKAVDSSVKQCLSSLRLKDFTRCYANVQGPNRDRIVQAIYSQFTEVFKNTMEEEVTLLFEEENIVPLLNNLNEMQAVAPDSAAWRPSGNAVDDIRSHLMAVKYNYRDKLRANLKGLEKETTKLKLDVLESRNRVVQMKKDIEERSNRLELNLEEVRTPTKDSVENLLAELGEIRKPNATA